jgi:competence ComEA-like helix-hairpin-helix protein
MTEPSVTPPTRRQALVTRTEQVALILLALVLVAGVAYRAISYWRIGQPPLEAVPPADGPNFRVNVNTADWATLSAVPGMGPKLSQGIVKLRDSRPDGRLHSLDELLEVRGIGQKMLARLKPYLVLDGPTGPAGEPVQMLEPRPAAP